MDLHRQVCSSCCMKHIKIKVLSEIVTLIIVSFIYTLWTHTSTSTSSFSPITNPQPSKLLCPSSPKSQEGRESKRNSNSAHLVTPKKAEFGFIWMSVPKNYRWERSTPLLWFVN